MRWLYPLISVCLVACRVQGRRPSRPLITPPPLFPRAEIRDAVGSSLRDQGKAIVSEKGGSTKWIGVNDPAQFLTIPNIGKNTEYLTEEQGTTKWIGSNSEYLTEVITTTSQDEVIVTTSLAGAKVNMDTSKGVLSVTLPPKAVNAFTSAAAKACKPARIKRADNACVEAYLHALDSAEDVEIDPYDLPNIEDVLNSENFGNVLEEQGLSKGDLLALLEAAASNAARRYYALAIFLWGVWKMKGNIPNLVDYKSGPRPTSTSSRSCPTGAMAPYCEDKDCNGDINESCVEEKYTTCSCLPIGTAKVQYLDPWVLDGQQKVLEAFALGDGVLIDAPKLTPTPSCTQYWDQSEKAPGQCLMLLKPTPTNGDDCPPSTTEGQLCTALGASLPTSSVTCGFPFDTDDKTFYGRFDVDIATDAINKLCEDPNIKLDPNVQSQPHSYMVGSTGDRGNLYWQYVNEQVYGKIAMAIQVGWAPDQKHCSRKQAFKLVDHQEGCKAALQRAVNDCNTDTTRAKFGGSLLDYSKDHGCLIWDIGSASGFQSEPNAKPPR